jgi:hypothetical protein
LISMKYCYPRINIAHKATALFTQALQTVCQRQNRNLRTTGEVVLFGAARELSRFKGARQKTLCPLPRPECVAYQMHTTIDTKLVSRRRIGNIVYRVLLVGMRDDGEGREYVHRKKETRGQRGSKTSEADVY